MIARQVLIAAVAAVTVAIVARGANAQQAGVRVGVTIEPETVRVGQPALMRVRVLAPAGSRLSFPPAIDSTAGVEPLDPVSVQQAAKGGLIESIATYRFLAWDLGSVPVPLATIRFEQDGKVQDLTVGDPRVIVESVLPADTAQRKPRGARDIVLFPPSRWAWWLLILAAFTIAAAAGWWLQRRGRRAAPAIEPFAEAQRAFGRLAALDLIGVGEPAKHVGAAADILRNFLAARDARATLGLTTDELAALMHDARVAAAPRVAALLSASDAIKFAGGRVEAATAESLGAEAANLVRELHRADVDGAAA